MTATLTDLTPLTFCYPTFGCIRVTFGARASGQPHQIIIALGRCFYDHYCGAIHVRLRQ